MTKSQRARVRKWIAMLRSGEFQQARGQLRLNDRYCCLGVACELYSVERGGYWEDGDRFVGDFIDKNTLDDGITAMPHCVRTWFGLSYRAHNRLFVLNDDKELPFPVIADVLEGLLERDLLHDAATSDEMEAVIWSEMEAVIWSD